MPSPGYGWPNESKREQSVPRARLRALDAPGPGRFNTRPRCGVTRRTITKHPPGQVAQLVEQGTENPRVGGSIPSLATIVFNELRALTITG